MFHIVIVFPSGTDRRTRHEQNHLDRDDLDQSRSDDEEKHPLEYLIKSCSKSPKRIQIKVDGHNESGPSVESQYGSTTRLFKPLKMNGSEINLIASTIADHPWTIWLQKWKVGKSERPSQQLLEPSIFNESSTFMALHF